MAIKHQKMAIVKVQAGEVMLCAEVRAGKITNLSVFADRMDQNDPWTGLTHAIEQDHNKVIEFIGEIALAITETTT